MAHIASQVILTFLLGRVCVCLLKWYNIQPHSFNVLCFVLNWVCVCVQLTRTNDIVTAREVFVRAAHQVSLELYRKLHHALSRQSRLRSPCMPCARLWETREPRLFVNEIGVCVRDWLNTCFFSVTHIQRPHHKRAKCHVWLRFLLTRGWPVGILMWS